MEIYKNLSGNSGIKSYRFDHESITVEFTDGSTYLYNYETNGKHAIEMMKGLAENGFGLTTYINQKIRSKYARKIK